MVRSTLAAALTDDWTWRSTGQLGYTLTYAGPADAPPLLPAGPVADFLLERRRGADTVTVTLTSPAGDSLRTLRPDGTELATFVSLSPGRIDFRDTTSATTEPAWAADLRLYPNPTAGPLHVDGLPADGRTRAAVYDAAGRRVRTLGADGRWSLAGLPAGGYWLRLARDGRVVLRRVMVR